MSCAQLRAVYVLPCWLLYMLHRRRAGRRALCTAGSDGGLRALRSRQLGLHFPAGVRAAAATIAALICVTAAAVATSAAATSAQPAAAQPTAAQSATAVAAAAFPAPAAVCQPVPLQHSGLPVADWG